MTMQAAIVRAATAAACCLAFVGCAAGDPDPEDATPAAGPAATSQPPQAVPVASEAASATPSAEPTPEETPAASTSTVDGHAALLTYLEAWAAQDFDAMLAAAEADSAAAGYAEFQRASSEGNRASGGVNSEQQLEVVADGSVEVCYVDELDRCAVYSAPEASAGLLSNFSVNDDPLAGRVAVGGEPVTLDDGTIVRHVASLQASVPAQVFAVVRVEAGAEPLEVRPYSAEYVGPDGVTYQAANAAGPDELRGNAVAILLMAFDGAQLDGTLYLSGWLGDGAAEEWEAAVTLSATS